MTLIGEFYNDLMRQFFVKEKFSFFDCVVVFVQKHLEICFIFVIQLYFLVQPLTRWFVQFVDNADYDFLGSGSEVSNVRNKVF